MRHRFFLLGVLCCVVADVYAQFPYGTTGLLHAPSAEMNAKHTVMVGGSYLHKEATPPVWYYETYNYYLNFTFFPWLEMSYAMTLFKGYAIGVSDAGSKYTNQDRHFSVRLRLWKEGWWKAWTPQVVAGIDDPTTQESTYSSLVSVQGTGNGYWQRWYLAATKHIDWHGTWGLHASYVANQRKDYPLHGLAYGVSYRPEVLHCVTLLADYDSRHPSAGFRLSFCRDIIHLTGELYDGRYPSGGVYFKWRLK